VRSEEHLQEFSSRKIPKPKTETCRFRSDSEGRAHHSCPSYFPSSTISDSTFPSATDFTKSVMPQWSHSTTIPGATFG